MSAIWTTRAGMDIPLDEMTNDHLANALLYCKDRLAGLEKIAYPTPTQKARIGFYHKWIEMMETECEIRVGEGRML